MRFLIQLGLLLSAILISGCSSIVYRPTVASNEIRINDQTDSISSKEAPKIKKFPDFVAQKVEHFKLENGLTILHYQTHQNVTATTLVGLFLHNPEPYNAIYHQLNVNWNQLKIAQKLYRISSLSKNLGAEIKSVSNSITTGWYFEVLLKDQQQALELLTTIVNQRNYTDSQLETQKQKYLLQQQLHSVSGLSQSAQLYKSLVFSKKSSIAKQAKSSTRKKVLEKVTPIKLERYFKNNFDAKNMVLIILSPTTTEQLRPQIESVFSKLNQAPVGVINLNQKALPTAPLLLIKPLHQLYAISRPDSTQVDIRISFTPINLNQAEYQSLKLFADTLAGSSLNSRMQSDLRERQGLSYSISNQLSQVSDFHSLHFLASTENHKLPALLAGMQKHIDFLLEHGLSKKEFEFIKQRRLINLQRRRIHPYRKMSFMLQNFTNEKPLDDVSYEAQELSNLSYKEFQEFLVRLRQQPRISILTGDKYQIKHHLCQLQQCEISWYSKHLEPQ